MGRNRNEFNKHLPRGMYYNKKGKTFYLRRALGGDLNLGKIQSAALRKYFSLADSMSENVCLIKQMIHRYMREEAPKLAESTYNTSIPRAKKLLFAFGEFRIDELRTRDIQLYMDRKRETPIDANRTIALLSSMYSAAIRWGYVDSSPVTNVRFHKEKINDRLVTTSELNALKEYCPDWLKLYIDLKLATGLRQSDMIKLNSGNWDATTGLLVESSKSKHKTCFRTCAALRSLIGNIRILALSREGVESCGKWHFFPTLRGVPYTADGFRSMWHKSMQKAVKSGKLEKSFREHDIRAMAATNCPDLESARRLLGHRNVSTTLRVYRKGYEDAEPIFGLISKVNVSQHTSKNG